jgi:hypothetical protein
VTPILRVSIGGRAVAGVGKRALTGQIVESDGERADELRIEVSNYDGQLQKPRREEKVTVEFGWEETGIAKVGEFIVAETVKTGPRATFHITGHSADLKKTLKGQKTRSWRKPKKLGDVIEDVAKDNQLEPAIDKELAKIEIEKIIAQTGESDMHLVTRLARQYGALAKFKDGNLIFVKKGAGKTASGAAAGYVTLTRPTTARGSPSPTATDRSGTKPRASITTAPRPSARRCRATGAAPAPARPTISIRMSMGRSSRPSTTPTPARASSTATGGAFTSRWRPAAWASRQAASRPPKASTTTTTANGWSSAGCSASGRRGISCGSTASRRRMGSEKQLWIWLCAGTFEGPPASTAEELATRDVLVSRARFDLPGFA